MSETFEFSYISDLIKNYRRSRAASLDDLSKASGVSRSMICNIECEKVVPSIQVLSRLARAMEISLAELVDPTDKPKAYRLTNLNESKKATSKDGSFICSPLASGSNNRSVEVYAFEFTKQGKHMSQGHAPRSIEYIVVNEGKMELQVGNEKIPLKAGDALEFKASMKHVYSQENKKLASGIIFIHYPS